MGAHSRSAVAKLCFIFTLFVTSHLAAVSVACAAAAPAKYVVGYATHVAQVLPLWLAGEQKFFLKHGIDIDPVFIRGAPTLAKL